MLFEGGVEFEKAKQELKKGRWVCLAHNMSLFLYMGISHTARDLISNIYAEKHYKQPAYSSSKSKVSILWFDSFNGLRLYCKCLNCFQ